MQKKILSILVMTLLIATAILPIVNGLDDIKDETMLNKSCGVTDIPDDCPYCMVSYWKLEDTGNFIAEDYFDNNDGLILTDGDQNEPSWCNGQVGGALWLPGDPDDAGVAIGHNPNLNFGTGNFALEAWIKYEGPTDGSVMYPCIMSKKPGPDGSNPDKGYALSLTYWPGTDDGTLLLRIEDMNYCYETDMPVDDGDWHHVVVQRYNGINLEFYVDGTLDTTLQSNRNTDSTGDLTFGRDPQSSFDTEWKGALDEIAVYDCALSESMIQTHYQKGLDGHGYCYCECDVDVEIPAGIYWGGTAPVEFTNIGNTDCNNIGWNITVEKMFSPEYCSYAGSISYLDHGQSDTIMTCDPNFNFGFVEILAQAYVCDNVYSDTAYAIIFGPFIIVLP